MTEKAKETAATRRNLNAEWGAFDIKARTENALAIMRTALDDVYQVHRYSKDKISTKDMMILNHACRVDLLQAYKMLEGVYTILEDARDKADELFGDLLSDALEDVDASDMPTN